jgi:dienelactone hydrolase
VKQLTPILLFFLICMMGGCAKSASSSLTTAATKFVTQLEKGEFAAAEDNFHPQMKSALPPDKLRDLWNSLNSQYGAFKGQAGTRQEKQGSYDIVYVTCEFEKSKMDIKIVFVNGTIGGLWIVATPSEGSFKPPTYIHPEQFKERDVTVGSSKCALPGTLTVPVGRGTFPVIVLVHGSGPNDRDETIGPNKPFRDIAQGIASRGIAVLRYDKRTKVHPKSFANRPFTVKEETIDDALAAVSLLKKTKSIDAERIYVLGHSLGGMLTPRIAEADPSIAGLIVMAGNTKPFGDVLIEQYEYVLSLDSTTSPAEKEKALDSIKKQVASIENLKSSDGTSTHSLIGAPPAYWLDLKNYNPAKSAQSVKQPMLILQGGRDYQVSPDNLDIWEHELSEKKNVSFKLYPDLNHLFITGSGKSTPQEYEMPGHVSEEVINDITKWLLRT